MKFAYGTFSKKGRRGSGMRLHHSEYFKYMYEGKEYFYKKKFYTSAYDGTIEYEKITRATFKKAVTRGNKTEEKYVTENFEKIQYTTLAEIISKHYNIDIKHAREVVIDVKEVVEELEKISGKLDIAFKTALFKDRVKNYIEYIIPVKQIKEII